MPVMVTRRGLSFGGVIRSVLVAASLCSVAQAAIQLDRTRLIVAEAEGRAVIQAYSEDRLPVLLQAWVETGQADGSAKDQAENQAEDASTPSDIPFIADPPVMRLNPGQSRAIQLLMTGLPATLPADRETLYWLNVLEVPARATAASDDATQATQTRLHISVQSRLKLFYRPRALHHYRAAALPPHERLRFSVKRDGSNPACLLIHNPAPIHQTVATLALHLPGAAPLALDAPMLAPFESRQLALPAHTAQPGLRETARARLRFAMIDDDGNLIEDEQTL